MSKNSVQFRIGDQVRLRSGGPVMTVVALPTLPALDTPDSPGQFVCKWFEGKRHHEKSFPPQALGAALDAKLKDANKPPLK